MQIGPKDSHMPAVNNMQHIHADFFTHGGVLRKSFVSLKQGAW